MVYVDNAQLKLGRMKMSHMLADTTDELLEMADKIQVSRRWIQHPGVPKEHFDVCQSKRLLAIAHGAQAISSRELVQLYLAKVSR